MVLLSVKTPHHHTTTPPPTGNDYILFGLKQPERRGWATPKKPIYEAHNTTTTKWGCFFYH
jgi:hypothetical protein